MLNDLVDNVYVLNLDDEFFKYEILKRKLDAKNIARERFPATPEIDTVDKVQLHYKLGQIIEDYSGDENFREVLMSQAFKNLDFNLGANRNTGARGCVESHKRNFKDAIEKNYSKVILFQDDIYFHNDFEKLLGQVKTKIDSSDIFFLGASEWSKSKKDTCWADPNWNYYLKNCYRPTDRTVGFFAVCLSKKVFEPILKLLNYNFFAADQCLAMLASSKFREDSWVAYPNLIVPDATYSRTWDKPYKNKVIHKDKSNKSDHYRRMGWNLQYYDLTEQYYV